MLLRRVNARELRPLAAAQGSESAGPWAEPLGMAGGSPRFLQALRAGDGPEPVRTRVQEQDLQEWGLTGEPAGEARERAGARKARGGAGLRGDSPAARSFRVTPASPSLRFPADWACALTCCDFLRNSQSYAGRVVQQSLSCRLPLVLSC